jgi:hypothetical protein
METVESLLSKGIHKNKKPCAAWWLFSICRTEAKGSPKVPPHSSENEKSPLKTMRSMVVVFYLQD